MTPEQIKQDENFLCGIELTEYDVKAYLLYRGTEKLQYYFFRQNKILFEGKEFRPSPIYEPDSLEAVIQLLDWMCMKKGDTDIDYFKDYNEAQFEWSESSTCEDIRTLSIEFWDRHGQKPSMLNPVLYFKQHFITG